MTRRKIDTVYLDVNEGIHINPDELDLIDVLEQHPEIKNVVLFYVWEQDFYTSSASVFDAYVSTRDIDEEYCFFGELEDAKEFARSYECWDGMDFVLLNGNILYGYQINTDLQTSWNDGYDHANGLPEGYDPSWFSYLRVDFDYEKGIEYLLSPDPVNSKVRE